MKKFFSSIFKGINILIFGLLIIIGYFLTRGILYENTNSKNGLTGYQIESTPTYPAYPLPNLTLEPTNTPSYYETNTPSPIPTINASVTSSPIPTTAVLPPLKKYKDPDPFTDMFLIFTEPNIPNFILSRYDGTAKKKFAPNWWFQKGYSSIDFSLAPNGSKILYSLFNDIDIYNHTANSIWLSDLNGENPELLVLGTNEWLPEEAIWSPDGKYIAYRRATIAPEQGLTANFEVWVMNVDDKSERKIFESKKGDNETISGQIALFKWYRNGYIYFSPSFSKMMTYALNPESEGVFTISTEIDPIYLRDLLSPDGEHIVFTEKIKNNIRNTSVLKPIEIEGNFIGWSKRGGKAVYEVEKDGTKEITIKNLDTQAEEKASVKKAQKVYELSPDDNFLVYLGNDGLYVHDMNKNSEYLINKGSTNVLPGQGSINFIMWMPIP